MIIKVYDLQNNEVASFQQADENVNHVMNVNDEDYSISGHLMISNADINATDYLKILAGIANQNISHFKLTNEANGKVIYVSSLFLKNIQLSYSNGQLNFRANIYITTENMNTYLDFLAMHKEI